MSTGNPADQVKPVLNWVLWVMVVALALVQLFATFRGLGSAAAMDQAQVARELARGHGLSTRLIRPMAVRQMQEAGRSVDMNLLPDTAHPPLQSLIWAPVFKLLESTWVFDKKVSIYSLDRAAACLGALWMLLTLLLTHGMARRMFDRTLANFAVLALALSKPLWEVFIYMGARGLLVMLTTLCLYWVQKLVARATNDEPSGLLPLLIALTCAAMILTHWLAVWIVFGIMVGIALLLPGRRGSLILIATFSLLAAGGWLARNVMATGDMAGAGKAMLQGVVSQAGENALMRDYDGRSPPLAMGALLRDMNSNLAAQFQFSWEHLLGVVPALLFFLALLHRFRRPDVASFRWVLATACLIVIVGMAFFPLPARSLDDHQIQAALVPALCVMGLAGFAVLWARFAPGSGGWWTQHGYAAIAIAIGGWPMITGLTTDIRTGLFFKGMLMQWPPYRPDTTSQLARMVEDKELLVSDAPWAIAWYADRSCLWLPKTREQFVQLRELAATKQGHPVAGFVVSPVSTQDYTVSTQFTSPYYEWSEMILRAPAMTLGTADFDLARIVPYLREYPHLLPLHSTLLADGRRLPAICFYTDRERWAGIK